MYSLPDALWVYAFTAAMELLWVKEPRGPARTFWVLLPSLMAIACEIGQLFRWVPGTFDWFDLFSYIAAFMLASLAMRRFGPAEGQELTRRVQIEYPS
jgi:hypothetical protein